MFECFSIVTSALLLNMIPVVTNADVMNREDGMIEVMVVSVVLSARL